MARRKEFFQITVPIFKFKIKLHRRIFINIIGIILFGTALLLWISFAQSGSILKGIYTQLTDRFGMLALFIPLLPLLLATHCFKTKKFQIITYNVTLGFAMLTIALLGFFRSGSTGRTIYENLTADFSFMGGLIILLITLIVGLILFLNTSVDGFVASVFLFVQQALGFAKGQLKEPTAKSKKGSPDFIPNLDNSGLRKEPPAPPKPLTTSSPAENLQMRSISSKMYADWVFPPTTVLSHVSEGEADYGDVAMNSAIIERTLESFGIRAQVAEVNKGPTVTQYALQIAVGIKLTRITALANDMALALAAPSGLVRIEAPIPGRSLVGIEIPNKKSQIVSLRSMLDQPILHDRSKPLAVPMGLDVSGNPIIADIATMPHVLIAGTTGSGKSVLLNAWIASLLMRTTPDQVRMIMVDPKRVELSVYNGVPHLMTEVIVEPKKIISALKWTVDTMEARYKLLAQYGVRNILNYYALPDKDKLNMPYLVFIIDELADLMIYAASEVEDLITRIAQMARAVGIHLVLATQRPSVDVITGLMKSNIPTRIAFNVPSMIDSRVVLDTPGAERLLGKGDMLYLASDQPRPHRVQSAYLSDPDVRDLVTFLKKHVPRVDYTEAITEQEVSIGQKGRGGMMQSSGSSDEGDPLMQQALDVIVQANKASTSLLQRRLNIGYSRAARIIDILAEKGYIGQEGGAKGREVLYRPGMETASTPED